MWNGWRMEVEKGEIEEERMEKPQWSESLELLKEQ